MSTVKTRSQRHKVLEAIRETKDPNEVTFRCNPESFPVWRSVLYYRYAINLPSNGYTLFLVS